MASENGAVRRVGGCECQNGFHCICLSVLLDFPHETSAARHYWKSFNVMVFPFGKFPLPVVAVVYSRTIVNLEVSVGPQFIRDCEKGRGE